jgi:hypothetical protein
VKEQEKLYREREKKLYKILQDTAYAGPPLQLLPPIKGKTSTKQTELQLKKFALILRRIEYVSSDYTKILFEDPGVGS